MTSSTSRAESLGNGGDRVIFAKSGVTSRKSERVNARPGVLTPWAVRVASAVVLAAVMAAIMPLVAVAQTHDYSAMVIRNDGVDAFQNVIKAGDILIVAQYTVTETADDPYGISGVIASLTDTSSDDVVWRGKPPLLGDALWAVYQPERVADITWGTTTLRACLQTDPTIAASNGASCRPITWHRSGDVSEGRTVLLDEMRTIVTAIQTRRTSAGITDALLSGDGDDAVLTEEGITLLNAAWPSLTRVLPGLAATQLHDRVTLETVDGVAPDNPSALEAHRVPPEHFAQGIYDLGNVFGLPAGASAFVTLLVIMGLLSGTGYWFGGAQGAAISLLFVGNVLMLGFYLNLYDLYLALAPTATLYIVGSLLLWKKVVPGSSGIVGWMGWLAFLSLTLGILDAFIVGAGDDTPLRTVLTLDVYSASPEGFGGVLGFLTPVLGMFRGLLGLATFDYSFFSGPFTIVRVIFGAVVTVMVSYGLFQAMGPVLNGVGSLFRRFTGRFTG